MDMTSNDIYKIHVLNNAGISERIYVFCNGKNIDAKELFSETELFQINAKNIEIKICNNFIYGDDSIRIIKKKLISEIGVSNVAYDDIYLFTDIEDYLPPYDIFIQLSDNDEKEITAEHLTQLFLNMNMDPTQIDEAFQHIGGNTKNSYTYDDIQEIFKRDIKHVWSISLGQKFVDAKDFLFSANPFLLKRNTDYVGFVKDDHKVVTFENDLLFNYGKIVGNNIYLCMAGDVCEYFSKNEMDEEYLFKIYYPFLYKEFNIKSYSQYEEMKEIILDKNKEIITKQSKLLYDSIHLFNNIHNSKKSDLNYSEHGISSFHFKINNETNVNVPLDVIFKKIHATEKVPFIKYNPGLRSENIYRLYTTQKTRDGKFIPYLPETTIMKLSREIGKSREVALYVKYVRDTTTNETYYLSLTIKQNGNIFVDIELKHVIKKEVLLEIAQHAINPIIEIINSSLENAGYNMRYIHDFEDSYVEVVHLDYNIKIPIQKEFNLSKYSDCVSSIFDIFKYEGEEMRLIYKRVENFTEMNAIQILILDTFKTTNNIDEVQKILMTNYNVTAEEANKYIITFLSEHKDIRGKIIDNPGFPVTIKTSLDNKLQINVNDIVSLKYVDFITLYIDAILRMTVFQDTTDVSKMEITKLCNSMSKVGKNADKPHISNIVTTQFEVTNISLQRKLDLTDETEDIDIDDIKGIIYEDEDEDEENISLDDIKGILYEDDSVSVSESGSGDGSKKSPTSIESSYSPSQLKGIVYEESPVSGTEDSASKYETIQKPLSLVSTPLSDTSAENSVPSTLKFPRIQKGGEESPLDASMGPDSEISDNGNEMDYINKMKSRLIGKSLNDVFNRMKRLKAHDNNLFQKEKVGNFEGYSRSCQRPQQPIALNKSEFEKQDPKSYNGYAKYGTSEDNQNYYICPKYWCLLTNTSMTPEDIQQGKCAKQGVPDNIIPPNATTVPNNAFVYDLTQNGKLKYLNPGYIKDKHPDGHCLPCCFVKQKNNWDCNMEKEEEAKKKKGRPKALVKEPKENIAYIISNETFPIKQRNRFGFLPLSIQLFLQIDSNSYVTKENPALIKEDVESMLRYGIEQYKNQSILGVVADLYAYFQNMDVVPSVETLKNEILPKAITLDRFISYHNSYLVSIFKNNNTMSSSDNIDFSAYENTEFFKKVDINNDYQYSFFKETVESYQNFIKYLKDPKSTIDHTYLWDMIIDDNPLLIKGGVNLSILELNQHDITDHVELVCPTHSRYKLFDPKKKTVIILKIGEFYEPIYQYRITKGNIHVLKAFQQSTVLKNVARMLQIIEKNSEKYCVPLPSMPKIYKFSKNISLYDIFVHLRDMDYIILKQVMNYQGKIIGLSAKRNNTHPTTVYIPCNPSGIIPELNDIESVWIDDSNSSLWNDYKSTVDELKYAKHSSNGKLLCAPRIKMIEDGLIVGILTETNQFVKIEPPSENIFNDGLEQVEMDNYVEADKTLVSSKSRPDTEREEMVQKINLESNFYMLFRTTVRRLLSHYGNIKSRKRILDIIDNKSMLYRQKIQNISEYLKEICKDKILFKEIDFNVLKIYDELTCFNKEKCGKTEYCIVEENGDCQLVIPSSHLISGHNNEDIYYHRISDEILRYKRIRNIILYPKLFYNIVNAEYNLHKNEFIILQTSLTPDYFKGMVAINDSEQYQNSTHYNAMPQITVPYSNEVVSLEEQNKNIGDEESNVIKLNTILSECIKERVSIIGNVSTSMWKRIFPTNAKEIVFKNTTANCSYYVLFAIFANKYGEVTISVQDIKRVIWDGYSQFYSIHKNVILDILKQQGKFNIVKKIKNGSITFENMIMSDEYYVTDLDIWVFSIKTKIQVCLFNRNMLKGLDDTLEWIMMNNMYGDKTFFIRSPSIKYSNEIPSYNLVTPSFNISELKEFENIMQSAISGRNTEYSKNLQTLEEYLKSFGK